MEPADQVEIERSRCVGHVEHISEYCDNIRQRALLKRIANIIRNGMEPEAFTDQMVCESPTQYAETTSIDEERARCIRCIDVHLNEVASENTQAMLCTLRTLFASGEQ